MLLLKLYQRWSLTLARFKKCYHKFYVDPHNTIISKMVFFCQPRLTKHYQNNGRITIRKEISGSTENHFSFHRSSQNKKSSIEILFLFILQQKFVRIISRMEE